MKTDFYLAHPISKRHLIRDELQRPLQELGYVVKNPFYDEDFQPRQDVDDIDAGRAVLYDITPARARQIVKGDLDAIDSAESIIVYLPWPSIGTSMELFYASHVKNKYSLTVTTNDLKLHPWIETYSDVKPNTVAEILEAIWKEDTGE